MPELPGRDALIRFLAERRTAVPMAEAAALLGWPPAKLRAQIDADARVGEHVAWEEVAYWLLYVWPRRALLHRLGDAAILIPGQLHLTPVPWQLPVYLVRAIERQAAQHRGRREDLHGLDVEEHVAEVLHVQLEEETIATFDGDGDFRLAYDFPYGEER